MVSYMEKNDNLCHDAFDVFYKSWPGNAEQIVKLPIEAPFTLCPLTQMIPNGPK